MRVIRIPKDKEECRDISCLDCGLLNTDYCQTVVKSIKKEENFITFPKELSPPIQVDSEGVPLYFKEKIIPLEKKIKRLEKRIEILEKEPRFKSILPWGPEQSLDPCTSIIPCGTSSGENGTHCLITGKECGMNHTTGDSVLVDKDTFVFSTSTDKRVEVELPTATCEHLHKPIITCKGGGGEGNYCLNVTTSSDSTATVTYNGTELVDYDIDSMKPLTFHVGQGTTFGGTKEKEDSKKVSLKEQIKKRWKEIDKIDKIKYEIKTKSY